MAGSFGRSIWELSFQLSPIILNDGIAANIPGGMLPIIAITQAASFVEGILTGGDNINPNDFFANFVVIPGDTMIDQQIGKYPFANQAVAANAVISQPLKVSMLMICPARGEAGYITKLATMQALQYTLKQHNASGGTYTVITPSVFYTNCVLLGISDASSGDSKQQQSAWRWDFEQPLLTQAQATLAEQALSGVMSRIGLGVETNGQPGLGSVFQGSASTPSIIPSASGAVSGQTGITPNLGFDGFGG